jgi:small subunit ribosomal protein S20
MAGALFPRTEFRGTNGDHAARERRAEVNGARVGRIRTFIKKVEAALASGDKAAATAALQQVQPELQRGVAKGVLHRNTASRKFSRLTKRLSSLA